MQRLNEVIDELKVLYPNYEERKEQRDMWEAVYTSMKNGEKIAIHAPTGTGKSLGYIIPAIAMKIDDQRFKMTLSTFTLNLQEQLIKDVELGIKIYNNITKKQGIKAKRLTYTALKGQKNYFCKKRLLEVTPGGELSEKKLDLLAKRAEEIDVWDRQNLNVNVSFKEWEQVQVEGCTKRQCPFHTHCTYFKAYQDINSFDFVITNHSLWFTRFYYVEPWEEFNFFVFDEAHKLEKVLLETYTFDLSMRKFENWVDQGAKLAAKFKVSDLDIEDWRHEVLHNHETMHQMRQYLESLGYQTSAQSITLEKMKADTNRVKELVVSLAKWLSDLSQTFMKLIPAIMAADEAFKEEYKGWVKNLMDLKEFAMLSNHKQDVGLLWIEKDAKDQVVLKVTPRDINLIRTPFVRGSLVTSGTLAENRSCQSFAKRMKFELDTDLVLNSPFPLREQTLVYVGKDISPKKDDYEDQLEKEIMGLLAAGKQKTFILFTSNKLMWTMFKRLHTQLREMDTHDGQPLELWIQDKNNHKQVVESFKNNEARSILFGTLSYFEGIDLKGDSLTQIILTRLPYSVPTHPIQEILDANYGYSQWEAVVRYEQAFGRLIRTGYDYGAFCILDNRVAYLTQFVDMFRAEDIPIISDIEEVERFYRSFK